MPTVTMEAVSMPRQAGATDNPAAVDMATGPVTLADNADGTGDTLARLSEG